MLTTFPSGSRMAPRALALTSIASIAAIVTVGAVAAPVAAAVQPLAVGESCVPADIFVNSGEDPLDLQRYGVAPLTGALTLENTVTLDRPFGDIAWNSDETVLYG